MKLLRNTYLEFFILFYFSFALFLPGLIILKLLHALIGFSQITQVAMLILAGFVATVLSLTGGLVSYLFFSTVLLSKHQSVESFYR